MIGTSIPNAYAHVPPKTGMPASLTAPSRQSLELYEVLVDQVGRETWVRFRIIAPMIGGLEGGKAFADVEADFEYLCRTLALPYLEEFELHADIVAVTLMSRPVAFGTPDPDTTQFIELFRIVDGQCVWEGLL